MFRSRSHKYRFLFRGGDPESVDPGDFYADEGQIVWLGVRVYLEVLRAAGVKQGFITREKLFGLLERFWGETGGLPDPLRWNTKDN